jgi:hypothetical protein
MSKTFADIVNEDRRLALLRVLSEQPSREMNSSNLDTWLRHIRTPGSRAETMLALRWLAAEGLITLAPVAGLESLHVATLTAAGLDVAQGRDVYEGVSRPSLR